MRFSVECTFPHLGKRRATSRKSALCNLRLTEKRTLACAHRAHLTEKRTLAAPPGRTSPKDALWLGRHLQNASLREASYEKTHSDRSGARKMRFSVTSNSRVRFSSSGQMRRRLTEKRTLQPAPHGKSAFCPSFSPKGAFWPDRLTQSRTLRFSDRTDCAFLSHRGAREVWGNPPASLRGTMENASTGQTRSSNPPPACGGGLRQGPQASAWGLAARRGAVWAEGLADGAPRARSGHHQAASCGLRRCRELRISPTS